MNSKWSQRLGYANEECSLMHFFLHNCVAYAFFPPETYGIENGMVWYKG